MTGRRWVWIACGIALGMGFGIWMVRRRSHEEAVVDVPVRFEPVAA